MNVPLTVHVTQEDIANGEHSRGGCPIALALYRELKGLPTAVFGGEWYVPFGHTSQILPRSARRFIRAFDQERNVKPFTFRTYVDSADLVE